MQHPKSVCLAPITAHVDLSAINAGKLGEIDSRELTTELELLGLPTVTQVGASSAVDLRMLCKPPVRYALLLWSAVESGAPLQQSAAYVT